jgi:hypothetical protein
MHPRYQTAIKLRLAGKSYGEIAKTLDVSKGSLALWFKNLKLPERTQKLLEEKMRIAREHNLFENNRRRTRAIQIENQKTKQTAVNEIKSLSRYELTLVGAALYWGEGWKRGNTHFVELANSDPDMITLYLRFLREILQVPEEKLRVNILVHPNVNTQSAIKFWSKITKIPKERFHITHQISRASKGKRLRNSLPYGTLRLDVCDRRKFQQIKGWINGLIRQI